MLKENKDYTKWIMDGVHMREERSVEDYPDVVYRPEPVVLPNRLAALEMTTSACAIPARRVD